MNRAVVIAWHRYQPHYGYSYRVMFEHWLTTLPIWAKEVDALYLIDSDMNFTDEDKQKLLKYFKEVHILRRELDGHHWVQFKWVIPQIKEDNMLFLDNDVIITQEGLIDSWFKQIEQGVDFLGSFDGSGGLQDIIQQVYPIMKNIGNRMGSYYFILTKKLLDKIGSYTFEPNYFEVGTVIPELDGYVTREGDWLDSFGWFTLKMLAIQARVVLIADPRETIYFQPVGLGDSWEILKDPETPKNPGYYHIRNGNFANYVITSWAAGNRTDYQREVDGNKRELLRALAWFQYMDSKTGNGYQQEINKLATDLGISLGDWVNYMVEFVNYHKLEP